MSWKEKVFEEKMQPYIDNIYYNCFNNIKKIERSNRETNNNNRTMFLDKELGLDTIITLSNGSILTLQEKTLQYSKKHFQQFTFEYYNDPKTKEVGEWFKLAAQFYFFGYANKEKNGYFQYLILNIPLLSLFLNGKNLENYLRFNLPPAKANFYAIPFKKLDKNIIYKQIKHE